MISITGRTEDSPHLEGLRKMRPIRLAAVALAAAMFATGAAAQTYPSRPIKMIVPTTAGSPIDVMARLVAQGMGPSLGQ